MSTSQTHHQTDDSAEEFGYQSKLGMWESSGRHEVGKVGEHNTLITCDLVRLPMGASEGREVFENEWEWWVGSLTTGFEKTVDDDGRFVKSEFEFLPASIPIVPRATTRIAPARMFVTVHAPTESPIGPDRSQWIYDVEMRALPPGGFETWEHGDMKLTVREMVPGGEDIELELAWNNIRVGSTAGKTADAVWIGKWVTSFLGGAHSKALSGNDGIRKYAKRRVTERRKLQLDAEESLEVEG